MYLNNYEITDEYGYKNYDILYKVLDKTLELEKVDNAFFDVILVDEDTIHNINRDYRGIDRVTDVISFAFEDNDKNTYNGMRILGEIYICIPRMKEQAIDYGHSEVRELAFLGVHGLLHLLGYDHTKSKKDEEIMFGRQEEILSNFDETKRG